MQRMVTPLILGLCLGMAALGPALPVQAQEFTVPETDGNPFEPVLIINDHVISRYEFEQRMLFLTLLRGPGDPAKEAMRALIDDRLRVEQANRYDIKVSAEDVQKGMTEFASRANLSAEEFVKALGQGGVAAETFRDFVAAGLVWRELVRGKYGPFANVSEAEVDRVVEAEIRQTALRVLLSELVIPAAPGEELEVLALARDIQARVHSEGAFAAEVANHSAAGSRGNGGRLDWMPLANLPATVAPYVLGLAPGEVSEPLAVPGAVALFQLRGVQAMPAEKPVAVEVDYATVTLPNDAAGAALLAQLQARADGCNDIWGVMGEGNKALVARQKQPMGAVPGDIGLALARLDPGEHTVLNRGGAQVFVQLCLRGPAPPEGSAGIDHNKIRGDLINQQLNQRAELWLKELRANAIIRQP